MVEEIIKILKSRNETISFMESCTGGFLANQITNIEGASDVLKVSLVTYSNEYKVKFGVGENTINEKNVYSNFTSQEMAEKASEFAKSEWGIGVTGRLGIDGIITVYYTIYNNDGNTKEFYDYIINATRRYQRTTKAIRG